MSLRQVVQILVGRAEAFGVASREWSIGETLRGDEVYLDLVAWAAQAPMPLDRSLYDAVDGVVFERRPISRLEAYGLALLALAAEHGRRHARAGEIWKSFADLPFREDERGRVLTLINQPTPGFKAAIAAAVRRFRLRNTLSEGDTHRWATTVFLQFGMSLESLARLPLWLAYPDTASDAVRILADPTAGSENFRGIWNHLKRARKQLSPDQLATLVRNDPWFGWSSEASALACGAAFAPRPASSVSGAGTEPEDEGLDEPRIVGQPRYRTSSPLTQPVFEVDLLPWPATDSSPGALDLWLDGARLVRLVRDGHSYTPVDGFRTRALPPALEAAVVLRDRAGEGVDDAQSVRVLDPERDWVAVYDTATGERVLGPLRTIRSYVLVLSPGASVEPANLDSVAFGEGTVTHLTAPWETVRVLSQGQVVWEPTEAPAAVSRKRPEPAPRRPGLELLRDGWWVAIESDAVLDRRDIETTQARIAHPDGWEFASMVGGELVLRRAPRHSARISSCRGYGEPLWLARGRCVAHPDVPRLPLLRSVTDRGSVVELRGDLLLMRDPIAWDDACSVVLWLRDGRVVRAAASPTDASSIGLALSVALPDSLPVRAAAVAHGGARLGAWWADDWSEALPCKEDEVLRALTAARWMKVPLVAEPHRTNLQQLAKAHLGAAYRAWVRPPAPSLLDGLPIELSSSVAWSNVARTVLYDCELDWESRSLVNDALQGAEPSEFVRMYLGLGGVGARARLPRFLLLDVGPEPIVGFHRCTQDASAGFARQSQLYYLGAEEQIHGNTRRRLLTELRREAVVDLRLFDEQTLETLVKGTAQWAAARCALVSEAFRAYASCVRLEPIAYFARAR